jgi:hypothetical protein
MYKPLSVPCIVTNPDTALCVRCSDVHSNVSDASASGIAKVKVRSLTHARKFGLMLTSQRFVNLMYKCPICNVITTTCILIIIYRLQAKMLIILHSRLNMVFVD